MSNTIVLKLYAACEWISETALLTLCWLLFTILGLGIFGFMPATGALFAVSRKKILKEPVPVFQTFFAAYKKDFLSMNLWGLALGGTASFMLLNFNILYAHAAEFPMAMAVPFLIGLLLFGCFLVNFFPVFCHFQLKPAAYLKHTVMVSLLQPMKSLLMLGWVLAVGLLSLIFPFLIPFFTMGAVAHGLNYLALKGYKKMASA